MRMCGMKHLWIPLLCFLPVLTFSKEVVKPDDVPQPGLAHRLDEYFKFAVFVMTEDPEIVEKGGRSFRVLLQDTESKEVRPKLIRKNASGFFLTHEDAFYFVTATHVARHLNPGSAIGFINPLGESRKLLIGKLVGSQDTLDWRNHPSTDISVLKLNIGPNGHRELTEISMVLDDLYLEVPPRTSRLVVSGFPGGMGTRGGTISPITSVVHLASDELTLNIMLEGIPVKKAYLVNPPAGKGFSGAPIFYKLEDGSVKCVGLLNGAWSDPTGGKFSISAPARHLHSLIDKK